MFLKNLLGRINTAHFDSKIDGRENLPPDTKGKRKKRFKDAVKQAKKQLRSPHDYVRAYAETALMAACGAMENGNTREGVEGVCELVEEEGDDEDSEETANGLWSQPT